MATDAGAWVRPPPGYQSTHCYGVRDALGCALVTVRNRLRVTANKMLLSQMLKRKDDEYEKPDHCSKPAPAPNALSR